MMYLVSFIAIFTIDLAWFIFTLYETYTYLHTSFTNNKIRCHCTENLRSRFSISVSHLRNPRRQHFESIKPTLIYCSCVVTSCTKGKGAYLTSKEIWKDYKMVRKLMPTEYSPVTCKSKASNMIHSNMELASLVSYNLRIHD